MILDAPDSTLAALDHHPGDRPQVAVRGRGGRAARAHQAEATSGPHLEPVAPPATLPAFAAPAAGSLQPPPRAVPEHRRARRLAFLRRPFAQSPLTPRVLSYRRDITPAQAPRDGSAHSCGSTWTYGATPPRLGAAHGSNRCRPTTRLLPLPLSAMRPLRQCTPQTRRQIPLRLAAFAAMRPPPALIITSRLLSYTFLPCAGERTAAAMVEPRVG